MDVQSNILFLDFDGVINSTVFREETGEDICPAMVERVNEIIRRTDAKVVVSSSWRHFYSPDELQEILEEKGFEGEIIDMIEPNQFLQQKRGHLIINWVTRHQEEGEYVALDDKSDLRPLDKRHVHTDPFTGITDEDVEVAIEVLNGGSDGT